MCRGHVARLARKDVFERFARWKDSPASRLSDTNVLENVRALRIEAMGAPVPIERFVVPFPFAISVSERHIRND